MFKTYSVEAVVLSRKNIGEADRLVTLFTKQYGRKKAIAKGIRKISSRRAPHLEIFSVVSLTLHTGKTWDIVSEVAPINNFTHLKSTLGRISYAYIVVELVDRLTAEGQEHYRIYKELVSFLKQLDNKTLKQEDAKKELIIFKRFLLVELGFLGEDQNLSADGLDNQINKILESDLKSPKLLTKLKEKI